MTLLMFLGEFIAGLLLYLYELSFLPKKKITYFMGIKLIQAKSDLKPSDTNIKIYFLIFIASFFDFVEYMISTYYLAKYSDMSNTLEMRLSGILTISSALFFYFLLKLPIHKHHFFSLSVILFCLIIIIISEYIFQYIHVKKFTFKLLLIFFIHFFNSLLDSIEKYLLEYDFVNPFKTLMLEGIFGFILTFIYSFLENSFIEIKEYYDNNKKLNFSFFIFCLLLYFMLSGGRNAYRVVTNKIYSPMTKSLTDYFLNPIVIIYYFIIENDFRCGEKKSIFYFCLNFIFSIIIDICSCVYNEILILFFCDLEYNTHKEIAYRASDVDRNSELEFDDSSNSL